MKRLIVVLLALAMVVPQMAAAQPVKAAATQAALAVLQPPRSVTATATESTVTVEWNSPSQYFGDDFAFQSKVNTSSPTTLAAEVIPSSNPVRGRGTISASTMATTAPNTIWIRVVNTTSGDASDWVATSVNIPPQPLPSLPVTITGDGISVNKDASVTVTIQLPKNTTVTVGYVLSEEGPEATPPDLNNPQTFENTSTISYTFKAIGPGQVLVRFAGDDENGPTDVWSEIFEVILPPLDLTVVGGGTVARGSTATATIGAPLGKQITVGYLVGDDLSQVKTLTGGGTYTFTANATGRVRATFAGDDNNASTTVDSAQYTVVENPFPLTVTGGGGPFAYGTTQTAVITIAATATVPITVGYKVDGRALEQTATFTTTGTYTFRATGTGQVVATFPGNTEFDATTAMSGIYKVAPIISVPSVSSTKVGVFKTFSATAIITPSQANASLLGFRCYHLERQSDGTYKYVLRATVAASSVETAGPDSSRMSASLRLTRVGRWHVVAFYAGSNVLEAAQGTFRTVTVIPVISKANAPATARRLRPFTVTASIMPRQSSSLYTRFRCYHRERRSNGTFRYVLRKTVVAKVSTINSTTSKLTARFSLPSRGTWRIAAYYKGSPYVPAVQGAGDSMIVK